MADEELLTKIKTMLGITGDYNDEALKLYIDETRFFMRSAGVAQSVVDSSAAVGVIMRGVSDLWDTSSGGVTFSDYFIKRVIQLAAENPTEAGGEGNV